jgi:hypothetical protein
MLGGIIFLFFIFAIYFHFKFIAFHERRTKICYDSIFEDIASSKGETDNFERIILNLEKITWYRSKNYLRVGFDDNLEVLLRDSKFKYKIVFLVLYWLKTNHPDRNAFVSLHDLDQFLVNRRLLSAEKLGHILDYSQDASVLLSNCPISPSCRSYFRDLYLQIHRIKNSKNILEEIESKNDQSENGIDSG